MAVRFFTELPSAHTRAALQQAIERVLSSDGEWYVSITEPQHSPYWHVRVDGSGIQFSEVFAGPDQQNVDFIASRIRQALAPEPLIIREFSISGFGPFGWTTFHLGALTVFVGANGTLTLAHVPNPPALVCIDEPEVGMHPRTLPKIAALLKKLSTRTQVLIATHSSYLLAQFDVSSVAVLQKRNGSIEFAKPASSAALVENLREFGAEELELMHRSDELEALT